MPTPTLFDWIGGSDVHIQLTTEFYLRVKSDDVLGPVFSKMDADHPARVAAFIGEVFGGPKT